LFTVSKKKNYDEKRKVVPAVGWVVELGKRTDLCWGVVSKGKFH